MITVSEDTTIIGVAELRTDIGTILKEIEKHSVIVTKRNKPVGVFLNYNEYEKMKNAVEELEDSHLGAIAKMRSERKGKKVISLEEAERRVGIR